VAAAAVLGRSFDADTVRDTSGRSEDETVAALEELVARGLLLEAVDGAFDFRHEQARELVVERMTLARRRLLHRRAAGALGTRGRREEQAALIAHHLTQAGDDLAAAESYRIAGDRARRLYANVEAASHFRAALALGDQGVAELQTALGDLATLAGDYGGALASYETAAANADGATLAHAEHRLGLLHLRRGAWELADAALASAAERLPAEEGARILADRSLVAHRRGDAVAAEALAHDALALAQSGDDLPALAQAHNILGMLAGRSGDAGVAIAQMEQSLELARRAGDREAEAAALNNLALVVSRDGEVDQAIVLTTAALEVCIELGDRHREAALRNNLADLLHTSGRSDESMVELKLAVAMFAEIGEAGKLEPEIWKLSEW
jgi:tetratricopeptide (TPR) repeat protein